MKKVLLLALVCWLAYSVQAQVLPNDCQSAVQICSKQTYSSRMTGGPGVWDDELEGACVFPNIAFDPIEGPSYWLKWEIATAGDLYFTIRSIDTIRSDIDFVVFKIPDLEECEQKEAVRCMWSGTTVGNPPSANAPCEGPTGLRPEETDFNEAPGCQAGDNNFLAPLQCEAGDIYLLFITDFALSRPFFEVEFGGSATLGCDISTSLSSSPRVQSLNIYPNPLIKGPLQIELPNAEQGPAELNIYSLTGQLLAHDDVLLTDGRLSLDLLTADWPDVVFIRLQTAEALYSAKLLIR
ncbi:MAG: hypothetical protein AAGG75_18490 [Bacteroidota bacterium]